MKKLIICLIWMVSSVEAQNVNLVSRAAFPGTLRSDAIAFTIAGKGYVGTGNLIPIPSVQASDDFWEYDPVANAWTQKASFPIARCGAVGFSLNNKGYVATGYSYQPSMDYNDLWEYDPFLNNWSQKANLPAIGRYFAIAFVINNIAFVGTGSTAQGSLLNDMWSYDPTTDLWQQKTSLPGSARWEAFAFSIGNFGYIGGGDQNDFYEYNSINDTWTQKNNVPNTGNFFCCAAGYTIGNNGYTFGGYGLIFPQYHTAIQEYDPVTDTWTVIYNSSGAPYYSSRMAGVSIFVINNTPYITQGVNDGNGYYSELFEISRTTGINYGEKTDQLNVFPNPANTSLKISFQTSSNQPIEIRIYNTLGEVQLFQSFKTLEKVFNKEINVENFINGIYFLQLKTKEGVVSKKVVVQH